MLLAHSRRVNSESRDGSFTGPYHADWYGFLGFEDVAERGRNGCVTELTHGPAELDHLAGRVGLHPRSARDFMDALVALRFLQRLDGVYSNTPETELFLDLTEGLCTGRATERGQR